MALRLVKSGVFFAKSGGINSSYSSSISFRKRFDYRKIWQLVEPNKKRAFLVDTLARVRGLEAQGVPSHQAEAITAAITEVLNDCLENVSRYTVSKAEMEKSEMIQESNLSKFKAEVQSSQEHHFSTLQREIEKMRGDMQREIEKMRGDMQREIEKMRGDMDKIHSELRYDINKVEAAFRGELEAAKSEVFKYCVGTLASTFTVAIAIIRLWL